MKIGDKISRIRKARGLSQQDLGLSLKNDFGVSRQSVSAWETGLSEPKLDNIKEIAKVLNVSFDALLDDSIDLNDPSVLQSVLNNDYRSPESLKNVVSFSIYRSTIIVSIILILISAILMILLINGIYSGFNNLTFSPLPVAPDNLPNEVLAAIPEDVLPSTNILGGVNTSIEAINKLNAYVRGLNTYIGELNLYVGDLNEYIESLSTTLGEIQLATISLYTNLISLSLLLIISFVTTVLSIFFMNGRKVGTISQNNLIYHSFKFVYIPFEDIESIEKTLTGVKIITKEKEYKFLFIKQKDQLISAYNQIKHIK